ncbi:MAG: M42 family metallopeptidase [Clostridia bacterium]|nr:M42 family metallopeptidase [Clostridia bacterium]
MTTFEILKELNKCFGPSGNEKEIAAKIKRLVRPYADEIKTDVMGNLIVHKKGNGPKLMIAAHMDSIGFIVTHIEKDGLLRIGMVGGIHPDDVLATPVRFANGVVGTIYENGGAKKREIDSMFIDIGAKDEKEAAAMVSVGDMAVYNTPTLMLGENRVASPYLDNRAGCVAAILAIQQIKKVYYDTYFVFTVQEELGLRGAKPAAFGIEPEYAIVADTTLVDDTPNANHVGTSVLGGGAAVKVMDKSVICNPEMVEKIMALAKRKKIKAQLDVLRAGGTDAGEMRVSGSGVWTGGISVATRYIHSPGEVCQLSDIEDAGALMAAFAATK